ncbi:MAG: hypothetical protein WCH86_00840 [Kiritimatiellales bacterium]
MISDPIVVILIAAGVLWILAWLTFRYVRFLIRGWMIIGHGRDEIAYVEHGNGKIVFWAEICVGGPIRRVICLPGEGDWQAKTPAWASGRRDEIVTRIKQAMPERHYEYRTIE